MSTTANRHRKSGRKRCFLTRARSLTHVLNANIVTVQIKHRLTTAHFHRAEITGTRTKKKIESNLLRCIGENVGPSATNPRPTRSHPLPHGTLTIFNLLNFTYVHATQSLSHGTYVRACRAKECGTQCRRMPLCYRVLDGFTLDVPFHHHLVENFSQ